MEVNLFIAALAGFIGAIILTLFIYLLKLGGQNLDIPYLIGTRFVDITERSKVYVTGITLHLLIGAGWGVLYVILLRAMVVTPDWPVGMLWGFAHGIFVGTMMGILADTHPAIGSGKAIPDPGIMGRSWGPMIPYYVLSLHIIYGACTLGIYNYLVFG
ncbi:hypothetical protein SAMN05443144_11250 [Fodinibius roseus]|uniref:Uncharacterized protein n=1 Tax=Fodinibius roseus TaxID=1194090 RepID=A0A1M5DWA4_9BACT|nr:hypothetical protein [Fodinibius roseus]SHF71121.1 hypothetical protein SAMN05443144_11250 [Fodinibius roseus]